MMMDQPFQILLELVQGHKLDPWEVDIEKLTTIFVRHLREKGRPDLRISGRALLSASTLLRMKSDRVLNGGEGALDDSELEEFPYIDLPDLGRISIIPRALRKITLDELMGALREALEDIPPPKSRQSRKLEKIFRKLSDYQVNIEGHLDELYQRIKSSLSSSGEVIFSQLAERTRLAVVRTLLLLLILFARGKVVLRQADPFGEIFISLPAGAG